MKIPKEELDRLLTQATKEIETFSKTQLSYDNHTELAELFFARADIYLAQKNYKAAYNDYEICLDYDAYFYEAVTRIDKIMEIMLPIAMGESNSE